MSRSLAQCANIYKSYANSEIFSGVSFSIHQRERYALIGDNGVGKSTLLRILANCSSYEDGSLTVTEGTSIGLLQQEMPVTDTMITVEEYIRSGYLNSLEKEMQKLETNFTEENHEKWLKLYELYEEKGGYCRPPIEEVLDRFELTIDSSRRIHQLSSGQKTKVMLAKLLIDYPDILLLDEPTNHLDEKMISWLANLLKIYKGAIVVVSHDRNFLNQCCNYLFEITEGKIVRYTGNYDAYLEEKKRRFDASLLAYEKEQEEKKRLEQKIRSLTKEKRTAGSRKDNDKMQYNAKGEWHQKSLKSHIKRINLKLDAITNSPKRRPNAATVSGVVFEKPIPFSGYIQLKNITKTYGKESLFSEISKEMKFGDRVIITGANGVGKSTLLNIIDGKVPPTSGELQLPTDLSIGFLRQEITHFPDEIKPFEYFAIEKDKLCKLMHQLSIGHHSFAETPFGKMSVGQKKRLAILEIILQKPNCLLLDEPTNHLDLHTVEALEKALLKFPGTIIAVSHDKLFMERLHAEEFSLEN